MKLNSKPVWSVMLPLFDSCLFTGSKVECNAYLRNARRLGSPIVDEMRVIRL